MSDNIDFKNSKKIFFLYPVSVVFDLVKDLIKYGYEVYVIKDHTRLKDILILFPDSIVYINLFEKMKQEEWEKYIKAMIDDSELKGIQWGICVYNTNEDDELSQKYLIDYGLQGGYVNLHISYKKSLDKILKILEACEAKGSRKYVRVSPFKNDESTFIIVNIDDKPLRGKIVDLSVFCMAVKFDSHLFVKNQMLRNVSIKLRGVFCRSDCIVKGYLENNKNVFLLIFLNKKNEFKNKIFEYIFERLQNEIQNC